MQIEHDDLLIAYGHLYLNWNQAAVAPAGECLPTTEICRRLARRMGLTEPALFESDETMVRQLLASGHPSLAGITLEALKARGSIRLNYPDPFVPFASGFPTAVGAARVRVRADGARPASTRSPATRRPTKPRSRTRPLARDYPFVAGDAGRSLLPQLDLRQRATAAAAIGRRHPADPSRRCGAAGHRDGDRVSVGNARGAFTAVAEVTDRVRRGVVASTKGRWPGAGANLNATVAERDADMGGGAVFHDNRVRIARIPEHDTAEPAAGTPAVAGPRFVPD